MIPPHAYIPGQTPRHPEDLFDAVKATARRGMSPADLARSEAWQAGRDLYDRGFYWECHEVLEAVWMSTGQNTRERRVVQAVIQMANARLKLAMGRGNAARRLERIAAAHIAEARLNAADVLGLTPDWLQAELADIRQHAREAK